MLFDGRPKAPVTLNLFQGPSIGLRRSLEGQTALAVLPFET